MSQGFVTAQKKLGMMEVIMGHLIKTGEISRQEFRSSYANIIELNGIKTEVIIPDNRKQYIQSVEFLSDLLFPYYDDETLEFENKILEEIEELKTKKSDEDYVIGKFQLIRKLFRKLNTLMKKEEYLAKVVLPEDDDDGVVAE